MKTIAIEAERRERTGKGGARSARREGRLPGVLYGQGQQINLSVDRKTFLRALYDAHGENVIFDVTLAGESVTLKSIAREIQHHPVSHAALHVDFQHIDMNKPVTVSVVVHLQGEPEGVRNFGGILEHVARELEVECLPSDIPSSIDIDVSELMIGDAVHISDIKADKFEFQGDPSQVVAQVAAPTVEKVATDEEAEGAEGEAGADAAAPAEGGEEPKGDGE